MDKTKKLCYLAALTALYVVLSAFLKFNLIGNIQIDLGYIAFSVALCSFGIWGTVVGVIGCALESILFSAYGFSISWFVANAIIGIGCGLLFQRTEKMLFRIASVLIFTAIGMLLAKTIIECNLYGIPFAVKIPKNAVAFAADAVTMICGLLLYEKALPQAFKVIGHKRRTLKSVAEKYGLTQDGVDYALSQYQKVICEITGNRMSKLCYSARNILSVANDWWCEGCDFKEDVSPAEYEGTFYCGCCNETIAKGDKYCHECGRPVKWSNE